ncbi:MAG: ribosome-binding factor [Clostridia bacterium]|jgi:ribosome-binding factor A|nr:ribosome-binding factor [Clostridia bacterium]
MSAQRMTRINEEIKKELAQLVSYEIKDPRVSDAIVSIVAVETTNDLKTSKVYISVLQGNKKEDVINGLNAAHGFLRKEVARRINLRNTPEFIFKLDESIEYGMHMSKMIQDVMKASDKA